MPPTNRPFTVAGIDIHRVRDGKMAEHWHVVDMFSQLLQMGIISLPQANPA
jgi:predicted SnoaL-like aldol condensation-catalyzing enzyme